MRCNGRILSEKPLEKNVFVAPRSGPFTMKKTKVDDVGPKRTNFGAGRPAVGTPVETLLAANSYLSIGV